LNLVSHNFIGIQEENPPEEMVDDTQVVEPKEKSLVEPKGKHHKKNSPFPGFSLERHQDAPSLDDLIISS
jgi:hypothetical protein